VLLFIISLIKRFICGSFHPFFGDIITTLSASKPNEEDISVFTVIEYFHKPLTDDSDNTEETVSSISDKKGGNPVKLPKATESIVPLRSAQYSINQGETKAFNIAVGSRVMRIDIDLNWGNNNDSLVLASYPPGGPNHEFNDKYGGTKDGRIVLRINPPSGKYVQQGDWKFTVRGYTVNGTIDYTFRAFAHIPL
jgi:hypothetical protein